MTTKEKAILIISVLLFIGMASIICYRYYFVFGEGVKAAQLNYFVKKGHLFKTDEGRLIMPGLKTATPGEH